MRPDRALALVLPLLLAASVAATDAVDDYVRAEMAHQKIVGLSIAVVKDGRIIKEKGYGLANVELGVPATPATVYKLASISKQFVAAGIVLLAQDGLVGLDEKVGRYLSDAPASWEPVTVRHLLTHTSGLVREAPGWSPLKEYANHDVVRAAYPAAIVFRAGERYQYCNVGYFTLASIIEKVSGKPWPDFLQERIFEPLGMRSTYVARREEVIKGRASGYVRDGDRLKNEDVLLSVRTSGGLMSTVQDLARWDRALYADGVFRQASRDEMWTPVRLNDGSAYAYGFGWDLGPHRGHRVVSHGGSLGGFRTTLARFLDDGLTVILLTNTSSARSGPLTRGVADRYLGTRLSSVKPRTDPDPATTQLLKEAITDLGNPAGSPRLAPTFRTELAQSATDRERLVQQMKGISALTFLMAEDMAGKGVLRLETPIARIHYYRVQGAQEPFAAFHFTADGKVAWMETLAD